MPNTTTPTPLAAIERSSAQQIASGVASALDQVAVQTRQASSTPTQSDGLRQASGELVEIIQLATQVVGNLSRQPKEEAEQSAKVFGVVAAVVLVVVAVVIAAFTFGAGSALVALAVIAATAVIGAVVAVGQGASSFAQSALGGQLAAAVSPVQAAVRNFEAVRGRDPVSVRTQALREIVKAMRELQRMAPQTERLRGPCLGDPWASYGAIQPLSEALLKLIAALRQGQAAGGSEGRAIADAIERLHSALSKAAQNSRPLGRPPK